MGSVLVYLDEVFSPTTLTLAKGSETYVPKSLACGKLGIRGFE